MDADNYHRIAAYFQQAIDDLALAVDPLAPTLEAAAQHVTSALLEDGKLICCAAGPDAALAHFTADRLMHSVNQERPPLPALALSAASDGAGSAQLWREARALCGARDVLLCIDSSARAHNAQQALNVARAGNHPLLLLSQHTLDPVPAALPICHLNAGGESRGHRLTLYAAVLGSLCHLVECHLFGE